MPHFHNNSLVPVFIRTTFLVIPMVTVEKLQCTIEVVTVFHNRTLHSRFFDKEPEEGLKEGDTSSVSVIAS